MFSKRSPPIGAQPGAMALPAVAEPVAVHVVDFTAESVERRAVADVAELAGYPRPGYVTWIDVQGLGDGAMLRAIAGRFGIHPLAMADVVNVPQRPKVDEYDGHVLVVMRMPRPDGEVVDLEQLSMLVGEGWVVTFQERAGDVFDPVRRRLEQSNGRLRSGGADYLAYALLDVVIDSYYPLVERLGDRVEELEEGVDETDVDLGRSIHDLRRELSALRRALWPQRDLLGALTRGDSPQIGAGVRLFMRDVYDHCAQVLEVVEVYRELAGSLMELHRSNLGQRTNEVMKVLTITGSLFIPLSFLAGLYGMNFTRMPGLDSDAGFPAVLALMGAIATGMLVFFWRKGWLTG